MIVYNRRRRRKNHFGCLVSQLHGPMKRYSIDHPHRRYKPLIIECVFESPQRTKCPWLGQTECGTCRVICFSPRHDLTLPEMELPAIQDVIDAWADQVTELGHIYRWVQVFENKGAIMGCSNPHLHGQIWALDALPNEPFRENMNQRRYYDENGRSLLDESELFQPARRLMRVSNMAHNRMAEIAQQ